MLSPSELGWDLALYAQEWLEERFRLTLNLADAVAKKPKTSSVHDVRVACRRLREAIAFFTDLRDVPPLSDVDRAARQMARAVSSLRETDVAQKRLAKLDVGASPEAELAKKNLARSLRQKRRSLVEKKEKKIVRRAEKLKTAITNHLPLRVRPRLMDPDPSREAHLRAYLEARVELRRSDVERLFDAFSHKHGRTRVALADEQLHAIRVAVKHWRYSSEIGRAVTPRVLYRHTAMSLRHLQELGGKNQDFVDLAKVVESQLGETKKHTRGDRVVLGAVRGIQVASAQDFVAALRSIIPPPRAAAS